MKKTIIPLILLLITAVPHAAFGEGGPPLTLDECVRAGLSGNKSLLAETEKVEAAKAGMMKATSAFLPKLDLSETYMHSNNPVMAFGAKLNQGRFTLADFAVNNLNNPAAIDNYNSRAQLTQPIFNGGKEWVGLKSAGLGLEAADMGLSRSRQETVYRAVQAYYGVVLAGEYVKVAEKSLETTEGHVKLAQSLFNQGMLVGSELLLAKVHLAEVKEMHIRARNRHATAKAVLNNVLGRPQDTEFIPAEPLKYVEFPGTLQSFLDEALKARPDLTGMGKGVESMEAGVEMAKTDYLPNLNFIARYDLDDRRPFGGRGESYSLLGVVSWNVFDGLMTTGSVREARANYNRTAHMYDSMKDGVLLEVREAYNSTDEARQRIEAARTAVEEGEEALRIVKKRFESGMAKTMDVLDAETALTRARTNNIQALYDYNVSVAALKLAVGRMEY